MTDRNAQPYAAFRLNFEQQQKRAKDLLKAAMAGEPDGTEAPARAPGSRRPARSSSRRRSTASRASCVSRTGLL